MYLFCPFFSFSFQMLSDTLAGRPLPQSKTFFQETVASFCSSPTFVMPSTAEALKSALLSHMETQFSYQARFFDLLNNMLQAKTYRSLFLTSGNLLHFFSVSYRHSGEKSAWFWFGAGLVEA